MRSMGWAMPRLAAAMALALLAPAWSAPARADVQDGRPQRLATVPLTIVSRTHAHRFRVEVARTWPQQELGLMFRRHIAPDGGMIFPMDPPREASFWMKNTLVPLDMVFIRADGSIARIAAMTSPRSLDIVASGEPVAAVLELAGGRAAALGIAPGDRVRWPG
jgi:uncharacterized membrane protein (UPF0127 family)